MIQFPVFSCVKGFLRRKLMTCLSSKLARAASSDFLADVFVCFCSDILLHAPMPSSQVHPIFEALEHHVKKWAGNGELTLALRKDVLPTFQKRREKHFHPAQPAAFMLDPQNFEKQGTFQTKCLLCVLMHLTDSSCVNF